MATWLAHRYKQAMLSAPFPRLVLGTIAAVSGGALALAFIAQYGFDLWPCLLCYQQRIPYLVAFVVAALALLPGVDPKARRHTVFLCVLLFAGMTAYDTQRIKNTYFYAGQGAMAEHSAIMGAVTLYLDFINLFQFLLYFMGGRRD